MKKSLISTAILLAFSISTGALAGHTNEVLEADLDGREEVGSDPTLRLVGDPDGFGRGHVFGIDGDTTTLCYSLTVDKIQEVPVGDGMMAHIHEGLRDSNGPVVAVLAGPEDGNAADCLTEGEAGRFPTEEAGIVQRILNNPEQFYINVHNPDFPAGAIRGQLRNQIHVHADDEGQTGADGAPSVPTNVTALVYSGTALELFWDRSTDGDVVAYNIIRDGQVFASVQGNSFFDSGLDRGTSYDYQIVAIDNLANESAPTSVLVATTN